MVPDPDQVRYVSELALNWIRLRKCESPQKRVAIILANYPNRDSRLGNGVGLDTPASVIGFLQLMKKEGFEVHGTFRANSHHACHDLGLDKMIDFNRV